jgi:hypothetical protein
VKLQIVSLAVLLSALACKYQPPQTLTLDQTPTLDWETVPFDYDSNLCIGEPLGYAVIPAGTTYEGHFKVTEFDGDPVTVSITTDQDIVVESRPYFDLYDPNDSFGIRKIYRYHWRWATTYDDIGLHYVNVRAADPKGAYDERTFLVLVKEY